VHPRAGTRSLERTDDFFFKAACGALVWTKVAADDGNEICAVVTLLVAQDLPTSVVSTMFAAMVMLSSLRRLIVTAGDCVVFLVEDSERRRRRGMLSFFGKLRCLDGHSWVSSSRSNQLGGSVCVAGGPGLGGSGMEDGGLGVLRQGWKTLSEL
jgi:hypothetical protein